MIRTSQLGAVFFGLALGCSAQEIRYWRGVLGSPGGELPFCLSGVEHPTHLHHGVEVLRLSAPLEPGKTLRFPHYDSRIELEPAAGEGPVQGYWRKLGPAGEDEMPFRLEPWPLESRVHGDEVAPTFPLHGDPLDISGRWRVKFDSDPHPAVAIFERNRAPHAIAVGEIAGTFLTVTGDYRYLAGTARGDQMRLAVFDGAHAFLFSATLQSDGSLKGDFWSRTNWHETWTAVRDADAALPDAFGLTKARPDVALGELSYPDVATGQATRLGDLFGKVTLVVAFGTWCPNCGDSGAYLRRLQRRYGERGLRIVGLAFEHGDDRDRHARVVKAYRERYDVEWPILLAGSSNKVAASRALPAVDAVRSFPTTLFVDDGGRVRAVHQGFSGPATGDAHEAQCLSFAALVQRLLAESEGAPK